MQAPAATAAFAVPLPVLVETCSWRRPPLRTRHSGIITLPRLAPPLPAQPSAAVLARLDPLLRAHGDALAAQAEGLDPERLSRTFSALMAELQAAVGMRVDAVELTPDTLQKEVGDGEYVNIGGRVQLVELPEGLRALAGELRELTVHSRLLAEVPTWVAELTRLDVLDISGDVNSNSLQFGDVIPPEYGEDDWQANTKLRTLPAGLFQQGALKQLTLSCLDALQTMPDASGLTSLESLKLDTSGQITALPAGLFQLGALRQLELRNLKFVREMPDASGLTSLEELSIETWVKLKTLPSSIGHLGALKQFTIESLEELEEMPDLSGLTSLNQLAICNCFKLTTLPSSIGQLGALKQLELSNLWKLEEMPDLGGLTRLEDLKIRDCDKLKKLDLGGLTRLEDLEIRNCDKLKKLPASIEQLGALKQLNFRNLYKLQDMPDTLGSLTALERLTLYACNKLKALPASIMHLSRLQHLHIRCPLQDMPCIEALTALRTLDLDVTDYTHNSGAFKALSRSLPCLQQLDSLYLRGRAEPDPTVTDQLPLRTEDVLAVGRALRAWPLPLLLDVRLGGADLSSCWQALGLPVWAAFAPVWSNARTLEFFREQQHKVAAFASGMHARLGAASGVSGLDEQTLVMIADEVLGGWGLLREWRQHSEHAGDEGAAAQGGGANGP